VAGPYTDNFAGIYDAIFSAQGCGRVHGCRDIVGLARRWLADPGAAQTAGADAARGAATLCGALGKTRAAVESLFARA
jgi:hypothetical protein